VAALVEQLLGQLGLPLRLRPGPVMGEDLGAVDEAGAAVRGEARLVVAPAAEHGRPLLRAGDVQPLHADVDHRAVGEPDHLRRGVAARHEQHRLVEAGHRAGEVTEQHQRVAAGHRREDGAVGIAAELRAEAGDVLEPAGRVTGPDPLHRCRQQGQAVHRMVVGQLGHQPLQPRQPGGGLRDVAAVAQVEAEPEGALGCLPEPALADVALLRAVAQRDDLVVAAEQERRDGQPLEVLGPERLVLVGRREPLVLGDPVHRGHGTYFSRKARSSDVSRRGRELMKSYGTNVDDAVAKTCVSSCTS
jgi:hypothetical protein